MTRPVFMMLVGLPGSGKSTFRADPAYRYYVHLSTDDFIDMQAQVHDLTYDEAFSMYVDDAARVLQKTLTMALSAKDNIIWDQTNLSLKKRRGILSQLPKLYHKEAVYFEIDEGLRQQRLLSRPGKTIPRQIDASMRASYVRPSLGEGFNAVFSYTEKGVVTV